MDPQAAAPLRVRARLHARHGPGVRAPSSQRSPAASTSATPRSPTPMSSACWRASPSSPRASSSRWKRSSRPSRSRCCRWSIRTTSRPRPPWRSSRSRRTPAIKDQPTGITLPAGTELRSLLGTEDQTNCVFRTAHALHLLPIEVAEAEYSRRPGRRRRAQPAGPRQRQGGDPPAPAHHERRADRASSRWNGSASTSAAPTARACASTSSSRPR